MPQSLHTKLAAAALMLAGPFSTASHAQQIAVELVATGFENPLYIGSPPGDFERLFVIEQHACEIRIIKNGVVLVNPFLNVLPLASLGSERGLLGMAFHPDYGSNGRFFINYTDTIGDTVVAEYAVSTDPDVAEPGVVQTILMQPQPNFIHNGGCMQFGPDGMLYIAMGDGGPGGDPGSKAQNPALNLGKMLRLDVDLPPPFVPADNPFVGVAGFNPEIWALGLRNPWRFSFDRATGDAWISDVGQLEREELNFQPASSTGAENYGWRCMEGTSCTGLSGCTCGDTSLTPPILEYDHGAGGCAIIGGYCYRGDAIAGLQGSFFYADYCSSRIWSLRYEGGQITEHVERTAELQPTTTTLGQITTFGEDAAGELYFVDRTGGDVFKIVPGDCVATSYCTSSPNSVGPGATISGTGPTSIATDDFDLRAHGAVPGEFGIFFYGNDQTTVPFGDGVLCVAGAGLHLFRLVPPVPVDATGQTERALDFDDLPGGMLGEIDPGSTWNFQFWYRDPAGPGGSGFNLSDGLSVLFCP